FAGHGIRLHKRDLKTQPSNVTFLIGGSGARTVDVAVKTGPTGHGVVLTAIPKKYWSALKSTFHGNLKVLWVSSGRAVAASLDELH
ncbi:MAG TPA: hypothetical protein VJ838_02475, partial [Gaiellaceae bacterium]|nr:hypothetical protein [Gaiellaceae bacterium]